MTAFNFFGRRRNNRPDKFSEEEFIAAVRLGGNPMERATEHFIEAFGGYQWKFSRIYGLSKDEVVDAFTDAVMTIISYIQREKLDRKKKISTLLYAITRNKCVDILRLRETAIPTDPEDISEHEVSSRTHNPEQILVQAEAFSGILRLLEEMKGNCREIIMQWGYWGYKMDEIAAHVSLKNSTSAKTTKFRCLQRLREEIANDSDFPNPNTK